MAVFKIDNFGKLWYNGGNWVIFIIVWFIFSGLMYVAEHSEHNIEIAEQDFNEHDVEMVKDLIIEQRDYLVNQTELQNQLDKLINVMENNPYMPDLFGKLNLEMALMKHDMMGVIVNLFKDEFVRIKSELGKDHIEEKKLASDLIEFFSDKMTVTAFSAAGEAQMTEYLASFSGVDLTNIKNVQLVENYTFSHGMTDFGEAIHLTSTIFMNTGYGWKTPLTNGGKLLTILIIIIQIPFYLHCLATLAAKINRKLDGIFTYSAFVDDEEELSVETCKQQSKARHLVILKGCVVLGGIIFVQTAIAAIYHYCTSRDFISFGDILYFELVRISAVAFGDILPSDEMTLAGALLKNALINIPSQITLFTLFIRILPLLS